MESSFKNFNRWLAAFGVAAFLMVAGWQVGVNVTDAEFSETEVALENVIAGSGPKCKSGPRCNSGTYDKCYVGGTGSSCICITC